MPGFLVHAGATVMCAHAGQAVPTVPNPRVLVSGQPTVTISGPYVVAGCALTSVPSPPCVTAQWTTGATRVFSNGQPLVVQSSQAVCVPTGAPLIVAATQTRVIGQ